VGENRSEQRTGQQVPSTPVVAETLRSAAATGGSNDTPAGGEARISLFWRVFGGTLLSIAALVAVTVYQQLTNGLNDLRGEQGHLNTDLRKDLSRLSEAQADLVKKDDYNSRLRSVWDGIKDLQADKSTVTALKERLAVLRQLFQTAEEERKDLIHQLQQLREVKAAEEDRKELLRELQRLRERLALLEGRQQGGATVNPAVHHEP
jgi:DNA repair exonuclease SbcCD ATPase subunit